MGSGQQSRRSHAFHITTDEVNTWDQFYRIAPPPRGGGADRAHSVGLHRRVPAGKRGGLTGDKAVSVVFDNTKIKRFCRTIARRCASGRASAGRSRGSTRIRQEGDRRRGERAVGQAVGAYEKGLEGAVRAFK